MSQRLQIRVPDELATAVREAAKAEKRSMSSWVALRLEEALSAPMANPGTVYTFGVDPPAFTVNDGSATSSAGENPHLPPDYRERLEAEIAKVCSHTKTVKRTTEALGTRTFCANPECGRML